MKIENNLRDLNQIILLDSIVCPEKTVRRNTNYAKLTTLNTTLAFCDELTKHLD